MLNSTLSRDREQRKHLYGKYLQQFASSGEFKNIFHSKFGENYKLVQYSPKYKHESLQILSYQFCSMGRSNDTVALLISVNDIYDSISAELDHLALTGFGTVILDQNDRVCFVSYMWDQCDKPPVFQTNNDKVMKMREICSAAYKNDKTYQKLVSSQLNNIKCGDIICGEKAATRPDLLRKGLYLFIDQQLLIYYLMGYKFLYCLHTHSYTIINADKSQTTQRYKDIILYERTSYFNFSEFKFTDGQMIEKYYQTLLQNGYDRNLLNKLKNTRSTIGVLFYFNISQNLTVEKAIAKFCWVLQNSKQRDKQKRKAKL